jgi:hypothetical protein
MVEKVLLCKCCDEPITEDTFEDAYVSGDGEKRYVFCNMECAANWFGDSAESTYDDFDQLYQDFKKQAKKEK